MTNAYRATMSALLVLLALVVSGPGGACGTDEEVIEMASASTRNIVGRQAKRPWPTGAFREERAEAKQLLLMARLSDQGYSRVWRGNARNFPNTVDEIEVARNQRPTSIMHTAVTERNGNYLAAFRARSGAVAMPIAMVDADAFGGIPKTHMLVLPNEGLRLSLWSGYNPALINYDPLSHSISYSYDEVSDAEADAMIERRKALGATDLHLQKLVERVGPLRIWAGNHLPKAGLTNLEEFKAYQNTTPDRIAFVRLTQDSDDDVYYLLSRTQGPASFSSLSRRANGAGESVDTLVLPGESLFVIVSHGAVTIDLVLSWMLF